jgi:hypothetical protein
VCTREALWNRRGRGCSRVKLMETTYWYLYFVLLSGFSWFKSSLSFLLCPFFLS